jgi:alpha-L-fucosidase
LAPDENIDCARCEAFMIPAALSPARVRRLSLVLLCGCVTALAQTGQQDPLAPTHDAKSAAEIDREWQASVAKYDAARAAILQDVDGQANHGPYRPDWETLRKYEIPQWYQDAKFGIFIHWGVFSVPGIGNEWYPRNMYQQKEPEFQQHIQKYGPQEKFGYKDLIPLFRAEKWDPADWAKLFKAAGARYVIPVAEHHDGFAMYDSALSDWSAAKMGPRRDVIGDLARALHAEGLHFGTSFHRAEHDWFFDGGRTFRSDVNDPRYAGLYGPAHSWLQDPHQVLMNDWTYLSPEFADDWLARAAEIVQKYKPEVMYFDWWAGQPNYRRNVTRFASFYYNFSAQNGIPAVIDIKDYALDWHAGARDFERGMKESIEERHWQTDTSISNVSWGYLEHDDFKTPDFLVHQLIDIVSKNGNLLLNIGPRPDGTIPDEVRSTLLEIGAWLKRNGEAIYGSAPWKVYGEGPTQIQAGFGHDKDTKAYQAGDFRFTQQGQTLYAIEMAWPTDARAVIHALGSEHQAKGLQITSVELLGSSAKLIWRQTEDALEVTVPGTAPGKFAFVFRIQTTNATNSK